MSRLLRYPLVDTPQHVIQRGHNRPLVLFHSNDYRVYLHCLHAAATVHACAIHASALMMDHIHRLLTADAEGSMSRLFQKCGWHTCFSEPPDRMIMANSKSSDGEEKDKLQITGLARRTCRLSWLHERPLALFGEE